MRFRSIIALVAFLAAPAVAQNSLPGLSNFTLETRPAPQPTPTPSATPSATIASPTLVATPSPVARRTPRPTATARPAPVIAPSPTPSKSATATLPAPQPIPAPAPTAIGTPAAAPVASSPAGRPAWLIPVVIMGLLAWAGAGFLWWRRRRLDEAQSVVPAAVEPVPVPLAPLAPVEPLPPAAPAQPSGLITTALRPAIELSMIPVAAGIDTLRATLDFQLTIRNTGRAVAYGVTVETWLFGAGTDPMADRNAALTQAPGEPLLPPFDLPAAANADLTGQVVAPRDALAVITAGERKLFVPMLVVRAAWQDQAGQPAAFGVAFLIGTERPGQERLAPLALDRGAREFRSLAARLLDR